MFDAVTLSDSVVLGTCTHAASAEVPDVVTAPEVCLPTQ